jgi:hypothetical protein
MTLEIVTMYDSAAEAWPLTGDGSGGYIMAYIDGKYSGNFDAAKAKFPGATVVPISAIGTPGTRLYDCEQQCIWPPEAAAELAAKDVQAGLQSNIYGSGDTRPAVAIALQAFDLSLGTGPGQVGYLLANPDGVGTVNDGDWGKQYLWGANGDPHSFDTSVVLRAWPMLPEPQPQQPLEGGMYFVRDGAVFFAPGLLFSWSGDVYFANSSGGVKLVENGLNAITKDAAMPGGTYIVPDVSAGLYNDFVSGKSFKPQYVQVDDNGLVAIQNSAKEGKARIVGDVSDGLYNQLVLGNET